MKTHTVTTYSIQELKEQFPEGFACALSHWQNTRDEIFWQDEIVDSLKALLNTADITLCDWSLGAYNRNNFISISFPGSYSDESAELTGKRAMAWLENNLFAKVRIPWKGEARTKVRKYGKSYRPGLIRPCPFTGYCADEDYIESLNKAVRSGNTLKEAFESLADTCQEILEREAEDQASEAYFTDHAEANEYQFTEDGEMF